MDIIDSALLSLLACPRDKLPLSQGPGQVVCPNGHSYAVVEGIPILLLSDTRQTHIEGDRSLAVAESGGAETLPQFNIGPEEIDPFVRNAIGATNGGLYQHLVGKLTEYPIPELRLPPGQGRLFLEVGCNWGRWCLAAARKGYRALGIDPSLKSIRAARRVARQLGVEAFYVVGDGRYLPVGNASVDQVFSYSVLQHLSKEDVRLVLAEIRRALRPGGECQIQMPNTYGLRCLYHQARRGFREACDFEVRYWRPGELTSLFAEALGPSKISVDGFFSLNPQISDVRFFPRRYRALVRSSEVLRKVSQRFSPLVAVADSLYISSTRGQ